ncbi:hypothetical protein BB8028_0001g10790 [Beauveria bassiana]|uniref:Uncharacterized protein n=2 Tax=Beauveria bassiana TaxID=176275 RepID=A0A0A2VBW0_BEABA|nr:hypothetical protein BBAD15_g9362 [Beauveria bassiana D1-5]PQK09008.1 hypothetical protein BB8028_0001g10790 [Beauveria bassiana]
MTADENAATHSAGSSSTWSGLHSGSRSVVTFYSSLASDPRWREPVARLKRWKDEVADFMRYLREQGKEGMDIIKGQEPRVRVRGRQVDLIMSDGSPLPEDLAFWKARHEYLSTEWRKILRARGTYLDFRETINPRWDWIYKWIIDIEAALRDDQSDASRGVVYERQPSDLPAAIVCRNQVAKKRHSDSIDGGDKDDALPSKRSKRNPRNDTKANASRPNTRKATAAQNHLDGGMAESRAKAGRPTTRKATVAQNHLDGGMAKSRAKASRPTTRKATVARNHLNGGMAESRDKAGAEQMPTARQPLRRSPRIAALEAAKAANTEKQSVDRPPPPATRTTTTAAKS